MTKSIWKNADKKITRLQQGDVHVWRAFFDNHHLIKMQAVLSQAEKTRGQQFVFASHQDRFIFSHGVLRYVLSYYLSMKPTEIVFLQGEKGKPFLSNTSLQFNLSHAEDCVFIGVANEAEIGVDVEHIAPQKDYLALARRFFSPAEYAQLFALSGAMQRLAFYRIWTMKEAVVKALGDGLSFGLDRFVVDALADNKQSALRSMAACDDVSQWWVQSLSVNESYAAAFAVTQSFARATCFDFNCSNL